MQIPRVIIIGETFRANGGGGITMMNLFREWPSDKLAVITELTHECSREYHCNKYYQIGHLEKRIPFPLKIFKKKIISGDFQMASSMHSSISQYDSSKGLKATLKNIYYRTIHILGLYHFTNKIILSDRLLNWVNEYSPDIIYHQPFNYSDMKLAYKLKCAIQKPLVVHVMDDIVSFATKPNLLFFYWQKQIEKLFRRLIESASLCLSISDYMSLEYYRRYNKKCLSFRNPVDLERWIPHRKNDWQTGNSIKIIYTGRLAVPNILSLLNICIAISNLRSKNVNINLDIYSLDTNQAFYRKIRGLEGIHIRKPVPYDHIPQVMSTYDLAVLPIDFDRRGLRFAKYSISTKTSEYLISGVPVLLLAPEETALSFYASKTESMFVLNDPEIRSIESAILQLTGDISLREHLAERAFSVAKEDSDGIKVRESFKAALISAMTL